MSDTDDICGEPTLKDEPCQRTPGWARDAETGPCIDHVDEAGSTGQSTLLEEDPSITELVAGALQSGATIPEACAEARISDRQYYDWRARGDAPDAMAVFREFREETGRARRRDSRAKRKRLWEQAMEAGDIRTAYKLYHDQHGDTFDGVDTDTDAADAIPLVVPENARPDS